MEPPVTPTTPDRQSPSRFTKSAAFFFCAYRDVGKRRGGRPRIMAASTSRRMDENVYSAMSDTSHVMNWGPPWASQKRKTSNRVRGGTVCGRPTRPSPVRQ